MEQVLEVVKQVAIVVGALSPVVIPLLIRWGLIGAAKSQAMAQELEDAAKKVVAVATSLQSANRATPENLAEAVSFALKDGARSRVEQMGAGVATSLQSDAETVDQQKRTPSKAKKFGRFIGSLVMRRLGV